MLQSDMGRMCRSDIDIYLSTRGPASFLGGLKQRLILAENETLDAGSAYNIPLINALIFYCGIEARWRPPPAVEPDMSEETLRRW